MDEKLIEHVDKAIETLIDKAAEGFMDMSMDQFPSSREIAMIAIDAIYSYKHLDDKNPCHLHGPLFMKSDCNICREAKRAYATQNLETPSKKAMSSNAAKILAKYLFS